MAVGCDEGEGRVGRAHSLLGACAQHTAAMHRVHDCRSVAARFEFAWQHTGMPHFYNGPLTCARSNHARIKLKPECQHPGSHWRQARPRRRPCAARAGGLPRGRGKPRPSPRRIKHQTRSGSGQKRRSARCPKAGRAEGADIAPGRLSARVINLRIRVHGESNARGGDCVRAASYCGEAPLPLTCRCHRYLLACGPCYREGRARPRAEHDAGVACLGEHDDIGDLGYG